MNAFHRVGGGRGSQRQWEIVLYDERGAETPVATLRDTGAALALRDRIESALADPGRRHFELALPRDEGTLVLSAIVLPFAGLAFLAAANRWRRRSPKPVPGEGVTIWNVSVDPDDFEPTPEYWRALRHAIARKVVFFLGIGVSLFVLYELARFGYGELRAAAHRRESASRGWLELTADHRCRFQGLWVFPGTKEEFSLAPARYEITVFDVATPDHWQTQSYAVELGKTTRVVCRPHR